MKLYLEPHEVTIILKGLDKLPRKEAEPLIKKIVEQDAEQKINPRSEENGNPILSKL